VTGVRLSKQSVTLSVGACADKRPEGRALRVANGVARSVARRFITPRLPLHEVMIPARHGVLWSHVSSPNAMCARSWHERKTSHPM
jgi:hypothetical protein